MKYRELQEVYLSLVDEEEIALLDLLENLSTTSLSLTDRDFGLFLDWLKLKCQVYTAYRFANIMDFEGLMVEVK